MKIGFLFGLDHLGMDFVVGYSWQFEDQVCKSIRLNLGCLSLIGYDFVCNNFFSC